jgi:lipopolysaccharide transport system ATP-binding protein
VINFEKVWKEYRLGFGQQGLRHVLNELPRTLLQKKERRIREPFYALRDINLEVHAGEAVGIIGRNGAGKTTLLRLITGITQPTRGSVNVNGRVSALIELGAGFHPDLTGRENIYLNGTILGLTRKEIADRFDQIVAFAELEKFIDTPVKRFSSGMYARLGFAVAAHTDPEVLLVDEVLAVGDRNFQEKCFDFILTFVKGNHTTVFISHNMYAIEQLCSRVVWLEEGRVMEIGTPREVLPRYYDFLDTYQLHEMQDSSNVTSKDLHFEEVRFLDEHGTPVEAYERYEPITVEVQYRCDRLIPKPHFVFGVADSRNDSILFLASMLLDRQAPEFIEGTGTLRCTFLSNPLMPRVYRLWGEVWDADRQKMLVNWQKLGSFMVRENLDQNIELERGGVRHLRGGAPIHIPYQWKIL